MGYYRKKRTGLTKREKKKLFKIIGICILFILPIAFLFTILGALNVPGEVMTYSLIPLLILEVVYVIIWRSPTARGKRGERKIAKILEKQAKKENGFVINDVIIPDLSDDKTSQIDHVYISKYTFACIETKNYSGRIYGDQNAREWTQVLKYGQVKNKLYNPTMQNYTHICRMSDLVGVNQKKILNIVVFVKGNTEYIDANDVYTPSELKKLLKTNMDKTFEDEEVESIYRKILYYKETPIQSTKEHVAEIRQMQSDIKNNVCPRCGAELVERTSKDGKKFLGCSNFPKCKFTKKI